MDLRRGLGLFVVAFSIQGGCASYEPPPVAVSHPAHPDAPAAAKRARSSTLAYTAADIPSARPLASMPATLHEPPPGVTTPAPRAPSATPQTVVGEGEVVSTVSSSGQIVLDHEEIKGFMAPMTMGYRVDPPSLLTAVKEGDKVRFTIDVTRRAIVHIEKLK